METWPAKIDYFSQKSPDQVSNSKEPHDVFQADGERLVVSRVVGLRMCLRQSTMCVLEIVSIPRNVAPDLLNVRRYLTKARPEKKIATPIIAGFPSTSSRG